MSQGSATVTIQFDAARHSVNCTTLQAVVLLCLGNEVSSVSFDQVCVGQSGCFRGALVSATWSIKVGFFTSPALPHKV